MRYSTSVPSDPDTHEDFRPTSKLESSGLSLENIVEQVALVNVYIFCLLASQSSFVFNL